MSNVPTITGITSEEMLSLHADPKFFRSTTALIPIPPKTSSISAAPLQQTTPTSSLDPHFQSSTTSGSISSSILGCTPLHYVLRRAKTSSPSSSNPSISPPSSKW